MYLNNKRNILIAKFADRRDAGIPVTVSHGRSAYGCVLYATCRQLAVDLADGAIKYPVKFTCKWDDGLGAWVGRRRD